jgi:hypothetical protein
MNILNILNILVRKTKNVAKLLMITIAYFIFFYVENTKYTFTTLLQIKLKKIRPFKTSAAKSSKLLFTFL